nr:T9SS type A sorting domain-containing protein [Saprospiraceae bacterium]
EPIPMPDLVIDKTISTAVAPTTTPNEYCITYTITATNNGTGPAYYDLEDYPHYGAGTTITGFVVAYGGGETLDGTLMQPGNAGGLIDDNEILAAGQTETFTIKVTFTIDPAVLSEETADCDESNNIGGTGLLNEVIASGETPEQKDSVCEPVPMPNLVIDKNVTSEAMPTGTKNEFVVVYTIQATNNGTGPAYYDLEDYPHYGAGTTITGFLVAYGGGETLDGTLMQPGNAGGLIDDDEVLAPGQSETFTVTVTFTIEPGSVTDEEADCDETNNGGGTGLLNEVVATGDTPEQKDSACAPTPMPSIDIIKSISVEPEMVPSTPGAFTMQYAIDIISTGDALAYYDLVDTFKFASGINVTSVSVDYESATGDGIQGTENTSFDGDGNHLIVDDESIEVNGRERWLIDLEFVLIPGDIVFSEIDCELTGDETGTGLFNCAAVFDGVPFEADTACTDVPCFLDVTCPDEDLGEFRCSEPIPTFATTEALFEALDATSDIGDHPCGQIIILAEDTEIGPFCANQTITRTYTVFDDLNLNGVLDVDEAFEICTQFYTILASELTFTGIPDDVVLNCGDDLPAPPEVMASEECGIDQVATMKQDTLLQNCGGLRILRRWSVQTECGPRTSRPQNIYFNDDEPPELIVPDDLFLECGDPIPEPTYEASDDCSLIDVDFFEERIDDDACTYRLIWTWRVTDGCGNQVTDSQTIYVGDTTPPTVEMVNPMLAGLENGDVITMQGCDEPQVAMADATFSDCCPAALSIQPFDKLIATSTCNVFGYYRRWECGYVVTDGAGNTTEFSFFVDQYDNNPPVFENLPADQELSCNALIPPAPEVDATDDCSGVEISMSESILGDSSGADGFALARTWTAVDGCGNAAMHTQMLTFCDFDTTNYIARLGNSVWLDEDADGLQDPEEHGVNNVKVYLYKDFDGTPANAILLDSTSTVNSQQQTGQYGFDFLNPGKYMLRFALDSGYVFTSQDVGSDDLIDSDVNPLNGMVKNIELLPGDRIISFDAGIVLQGAQLPVELSSFSLIEHECNVDLAWATASEINVSHFEVQASNDGVRFTTIDEIIAAGESHVNQSYSYADHRGDEASYYRLKIVDLDGSTDFSRILQASKSNCGQVLIETFPNPTQGDLNIRWQAPTDLQYHVVNELGQLVKQGRLEKGAGAEQIIDLQQLIPGWYSLKVSGPNVNRTFKIIRQ